MRGKRKWISFLFGIGFLLNISAVEASVIFNEILADPPSGLIGDANNDGIRSGTQDEFLELLNNSSGGIDISGWLITDSVSIRHVFPSSTVIDPYTFLVIFGGGNPEISGINWQVASSGALGLNNSGDTITLLGLGGNIVDQVSYGSKANHDQSMTLFPDGESSEFFLHSTLEQAEGSLFSPGTSIDLNLSLAVLGEEEFPDNPVVPELPTLLYFALGGGASFMRNIRLGKLLKIDGKM